MKAIEKLNKLSEKDLEHVKGGIYQPPTGGDMYATDVNRKAWCECNGDGRNLNKARNCTCSDEKCVTPVVNPGEYYGGEAPGYEGGSYLNDC